MHILLTGATGFVGRATLPRLLDTGHTLRLATRRPAVLNPRCEQAEVGNIDGDTDWRAALDGIDAVVHLAARVHVRRETVPDPLAAFRVTNVAGTRRLAEQSAAAGVKHFILLSSRAAITSNSHTAPISDDSVPELDTPYGISKLEGEQALAAVSRDTALGFSILRPPMIYGPGDSGNFKRLLDLCWRRIPIPVAANGNRRSFLYVENLADVIRHFLTIKAPTGKAYLVHDGPPVPLEDILRQIGVLLGRAPRIVRLSPGILGLAGRIGSLGVALDKLTGPLMIDDRALQTDIVWRPPCTLDQGLRATVDWYRALRAAGREAA